MESKAHQNTQNFDLSVLEAQYNARAAIGNVAEIFAQWIDQSSIVRSTHRCEIDISYAPNGVSDPAQTLDYFPNKRLQPGAPLLIFIHGGYWRSLDKSDFSFIAPAYTDQGFDVALINYGLAPKTPISVICQQTVRAIAWIYNQRDHFTFDANNITVAGHSAGGHLAAMAFAAHWHLMPGNKTGNTLPKNIIKKAFALSGLFDLEPIRHVPFLRESIILTADEATAVSPVCFEQPNDGHILTAVGELESAEFHRQSALLEQVWPDRSPPTQVVANCNHLTVCSELADPASPITKALIALIKKH